MPKWNPLQTPVLATVLLAIAVTAIQTLNRPQLQSVAVPSYIYPEVVPLPGWQEIPARAAETPPTLFPPPSPHAPSGEVVASTQYLYRHDTTILTIDTRYLINTNGQLKDYISELSGTLWSALRERDNVGHYGLFTDGDRAYISACLNPRGGSTVTSDRFRQNRYLYDFRPARIAAWVVGRDTIQDRRCLWTTLSVAIADYASLSQAERDLETAWFDWFAWWTANFPKT
ncbi:cyanoexosortase A system-associated protein [Synechococcus sp. PCC 7336]|uniref:cyanoexosortase A system-associated protein n=1 Tax=Synechococcus sp. PCC 7336 TaxID=195250 RepID=UPI00034C87FC|nr:cyanoexosortase A system-associated protein [Synechococcus sp. PCC 7336]